MLDQIEGAGAAARHTQMLVFSPAEKAHASVPDCSELVHLV